MAALAILLKGIHFSRKTLVMMGYSQAAATLTLRRLRKAGVIERTPDGFYQLGKLSFDELLKIATPGDLERIAEFAYDIYGMDSWEEDRLESAAVQFGGYLRAIKNGRASVALLQSSKAG